MNTKVITENKTLSNVNKLKLKTDPKTFQRCLKLKNTYKTMPGVLPKVKEEPWVYDFASDVSESFYAKSSADTTIHHGSFSSTS